MKIQQIRNATLKISYADKIFLIDPYLEEKNKFGCFADIPGKPFLTADNVKNQIPAPICELPFSVEKILENVDYYLLTHIHPDHIDMNFAEGTVGNLLDKKIPILAQDDNDAKIFITHMDNMPHATITRQEMRGLIAKRGIENYFMPEDGEILEF